MPTDTSGVPGDGAPAGDVPDDDLTFAVQDFGRERAPEQPHSDLGFAAVRRADVSAASSTHDGFVIRQPQSVAPAAPVDALVVGAPEPAPAPEAPSPLLDGFVIGSHSARAAATPQELWTTRDPVPGAAAATQQVSRRGWSPRHSQLVDRSAHATMLRLREEAVNVSWKAAWTAVTTVDPRRSRKRRAPPA